VTVRNHSSLTSMGLQGLGRRLRSLKHVTATRACTAVRQGNPVVRAAPTGVAAFNIIGRTLHSLFRLPVKQKKSDLSNATLQSLQSLFQDIRFLIIDEKSMIDLKILSIIDDRLRLIFSRPIGPRLLEAKRSALAEISSNYHPVNGRPLYATKATGPIAVKGQGLYRSSTVRSD